MILYLGRARYLLLRPELIVPSIAGVEPDIYFRDSSRFGNVQVVKLPYQMVAQISNKKVLISNPTQKVVLSQKSELNQSPKMADQIWSQDHIK